MNIGKAVDVLSATRVAEQREFVETLAVALADFAHHVQQHLVVADIAFYQTLEAAALAVAAHAHRKERAQHDAAVPAAKWSERIPVLGELPPRAMHHDHQLDIVVGCQYFVRHIQRVRKAGIVPAGVYRGRVQVVQRLGFLLTGTGRILGNIEHLSFLQH